MRANDGKADTKPAKKETTTKNHTKHIGQQISVRPLVKDQRSEDLGKIRIQTNLGQQMNAFSQINQVEMNQVEMTAEQLAVQLQSAKQEERLASDRRVALEQLLTAKLGARTEGAETHTLANGMKVTITGKLTRSLDVEAWEQIKQQIPEDMWPIKVKQELDTTGVKYLMNNEPQIYALVSKAITTKQAKTAVEVK